MLDVSSEIYFQMNNLKENIPTVFLFYFNIVLFQNRLLFENIF